MEGDFTSKGAVKMGAVKSIQGGSHINWQFPRDICLVSTFLHVQTWQTKHPRFDKEWALDFNVWFTGVAGLAFNISTLQQHRWNTDVEWITDIAQTDLLGLYDLKDTLKGRSWH